MSTQQAKGFLSLSGSAALGAAVIECGGQRFEADDTKAYVEFTLSHGFPVVTSDRTAIHPGVTGRSFRTLLHQVFNLGHLMKSYDPENNARDRMLGSVVAVEFPAEPAGGWRVQADPELSPGIRGVAVMHKAAEGVATILGQQLGGRRRWMVSMEVLYGLEDSGFLIGKDESSLLHGVDAGGTPSDIAALGYLYAPFDANDGKLAERVWDAKRGRIRSDMAKRQVVMLYGGLDGAVHYCGVGLTPLGKEPTAEVLQMVASEDVTVGEALAAGAEALRRATDDARTHLGLAPSL